MEMTPKQKIVMDYLAKGDEYAEAVFKKLKGSAWFEFLYEVGYFKPDKNPEPIEDKNNRGFFTIPKWYALDFLVDIARECGEASDLQCAEKLMGVIREFTKPANRPSGQDNYRTWFSFLKMMASLPTQVIKLEDIDMLETWLISKFDNSLVGGEIGKGLLPNLLQSGLEEDWDKAVKVIEIVTKLHEAPEESFSGDGWRTIIKPYWLNDLFNKNANLLGQVCGQKVCEILESKVREIYKNHKDADRLSYISRAAIEEHEQNVGEDRPSYVLVSALRDLLIVYGKADDVGNMLRGYLDGDLWILKRLALHVIAVLYPKYETHFWQHFETNSKDLFDESNIHHEMHYLLSSCFVKFNESEKDKIIDHINGLVSGYEGEKKQKGDACRRAGWFYSIKGKDHQRADSLYDQYVQIIGDEPEHPEFLGWHGEWRPKPTVDADVFKSLQGAKELVDYLNAFDSENEFQEIAYDEVGEYLKARVKAEQNKFEKMLPDLLALKCVYHYYILEGFRDLWNEPKDINWAAVFEYMSSLVEDPRLWSEEVETKDRYNRKKWVPTAMAQLIESGTRKDEKAFDPRHLENAGNVLRAILEKQEPDEFEDSEDAINWAINTPRGRTLESFITYALRCCRAEEKQGGSKDNAWKKLVPLFDREISNIKTKGNYEFSALSGRYLPNYYYMNKEWTTQNIENLFPNSETSLLTNWKAAMDGYSYVNTVYTVIYDLLKKNGDFEKVLSEVYDHKRIRERAIDNITVAYLRGQETLEKETLFGKVLNEWRDEDIRDVISMFWGYRKVDFEKNEDQKILDFWRFCYEKCCGKESDHKAMLSDLNLLAVFLKEIDSEREKWLLQSVPYVEINYHASFLLEYFERLVERNAEAVGRIYLEMLNHVIPTFEEKNVKSIVEKLYLKECRTSANQICDRYGRAGHEILKSVFKKYNP